MRVAGSKRSFPREGSCYEGSRISESVSMALDYYEMAKSIASELSKMKKHWEPLRSVLRCPPNVCDPAISKGSP